MKNKRMMDIHMDALAYAAGVRTLDNLPVSHPPHYARPRKHRLRRLASRLLRALASGISSTASYIDKRDIRAIPAGSPNDEIPCCS